MTDKLKISDLISELEKIKLELGDLNIITAVDAEGNGFRELHSTDGFDINVTRFDGTETYIVLRHTSYS